MKCLTFLYHCKMSGCMCRRL